MRFFEATRSLRDALLAGLSSEHQLVPLRNSLRVVRRVTPFSAQALPSRNPSDSFPLLFSGCCSPRFTFHRQIRRDLSDEETSREEPHLRSLLAVSRFPPSVLAWPPFVAAAVRPYVTARNFMSFRTRLQETEISCNAEAFPGLWIPVLVFAALSCRRRARPVIAPLRCCGITVPSAPTPRGAPTSSSTVTPLSLLACFLSLFLLRYE